MTFLANSVGDQLFNYDFHEEQCTVHSCSNSLGIQIIFDIFLSEYTYTFLVVTYYYIIIML